MNQTNSYSHDFRSDQSVVGSNILTPIPSPAHNYVIHSVIQSPSANMSTPMLSPMTIQLISANTSPNSLVLLSTNNMDPSLKCVHCGQVSTSPITNCRHCGSKLNTSRGNAPSPIETHRFYQIQNTGVGRARARMQMSNSLMNVTPIRNINKPLITNIRSLSNTNNSFASKQRLHQLNPKESKKREIIELEAENEEKRSQRISQSSDECIEIMDSNEDEEDSEVTVECDFNSEIIDSKTQSFEEKSNLSISKPQITANDSEKSLKEMTLLPDYAMFGTYRTNPKTIWFTSDGIQLTNVSPNSKETKFKYHIIIPFIEIQELFYCSNDSKNNYLLVKPTSESNHTIQESMYLGHQSPNGLKFDISSKDPREHYIIVVLRDKISQRFAKLLLKCCKRKNVDIKCNQIEECLAKHMLRSLRYIEIKVKYKAVIEKFTIKSTDKFSKLMPIIAEKFNERVSELIFSFNERTIDCESTAESIGVTVSDTIVCYKTYNQMNAEFKDPNVLSLKLRDKTMKSAETLNVNKFDKIKTIIDWFAKFKSIPEKKFRLVFDGERLESDSTIAECDIDDDSQIDVILL